LENIRFYPGELENDPGFAKQLADLCDCFVMDAFGTAHRKQASTYGVAQYAKQAVAGPLLVQEVEALSHVRENPKRPLLAIIGGAKISTKLGLIASLLDRVDRLILGGGIANTFLLAQGHAVGQSLVETDLVEQAQSILAKAKQAQVAIGLPLDVMVATALDQPPRLTTLDGINPTEAIYDVGPKTTAHYAEMIQKVHTILWNGPVGVFEQPAFSKGTQALTEAIAISKADTIAGGGDTLAAIDRFGVREHIHTLSTGGGAFLKYIEQGSLPAITHRPLELHRLNLHR